MSFKILAVVTESVFSLAAVTPESFTIILPLPSNAVVLSSTLADIMLLLTDIPAFVFIQEVMAYWLGVETGDYIHQPASLHYYDNFEEELLKYYYYDEEVAQIFPRGTGNSFETPEWNISQNIELCL